MSKNSNHLYNKIQYNKKICRMACDKDRCWFIWTFWYKGIWFKNYDTIIFGAPIENGYIRGVEFIKDNIQK